MPRVFGMQPKQLKKEIWIRLKLLSGKYRKIADSSDELTYSWVVKFANGESPNPTIDMLQSLSDALDKFEEVQVGSWPE